MNRFLLIFLATLTATALIVSGCTTTPLATSKSGTESTSAQGATAPAPQLQETPEPQTTVTISTEELVNSLRSALAALNQFQATAKVSVLVGDSTLESRVTQAFKNPNLRLDVWSPDGDAPQRANIFVWNGRELMAYFPDGNQYVRVDQLPAVVISASMPEQNTFPLLAMLELRSFLVDLLASSTLTVEGTETVAGRTTTKLVATPQTTNLDFGVAHIYVDQATFFPLRVHTVRQDGVTTFDLEYLTFDPAAQVPDDLFVLEKPAEATVLGPNLETLTIDLGFATATLAEAQALVDFPVLILPTPPPGVQERFVRTMTVEDRTTVLIFYGTENRIETTLIENAAGEGLPQLAGAAPVDINGNPGQVVTVGNVVTVRWIQGETELTMVTERSRDEAIALARSVGE